MRSEILSIVVFECGLLIVQMQHMHPRDAQEFRNFVLLTIRNKERILHFLKTWLEDKDNQHFIFKKSALLRKLMYGMVKHFLEYLPRLTPGYLRGEDFNPYVLILD